MTPSPAQPSPNSQPAHAAYILHAYTHAYMRYAGVTYAYAHLDPYLDRPLVSHQRMQARVPRRQRRHGRPGRKQVLQRAAKGRVGAQAERQQLLRVRGRVEERDGDAAVQPQVDGGGVGRAGGVEVLQDKRLVDLPCRGGAGLCNDDWMWLTSHDGCLLRYGTEVLQGDERLVDLPCRGGGSVGVV